MGLYDGLNAIAGGIDRLGSALGDQAALREQKRLELEFENAMLDTRDRIQSEYKRLTDMDPDTLLTYAEDTTPGGENLANFRAGLMDIDMTTPLAQERRLATRKLFDQYTPELEKLFEAGRIEKYTPMVQKAAAERMGTGLLRDEDMAALAEEYAPAITRRRSAEIIAGMQKDRAAQLLNQLALKSGNADFYMTGPGERPTDEAEAVAYDQITRAMSYLTPEERRKAYEQTRDTILQFKADEKAARMEQYTIAAKSFQGLINAGDMMGAIGLYNDAVKNKIFIDDAQMEEWANDIKLVRKDKEDAINLTPAQLKAKEDASKEALRRIRAMIAGTKAHFPNANIENIINEYSQAEVLTGSDYSTAIRELGARGEGNQDLVDMYKMGEALLNFPIKDINNPEKTVQDEATKKQAVELLNSLIYNAYREAQATDEKGRKTDGSAKTSMSQGFSAADLANPTKRAELVKKQVAFVQDKLKGDLKAKTQAISSTGNMTAKEIQGGKANKDIMALAKSGALSTGLSHNDPEAIELFNQKQNADMQTIKYAMAPYAKMFNNGVILPTRVREDTVIDNDGLPIFEFKLKARTLYDTADKTVLFKLREAGPSIYYEAGKKWVLIKDALFK